MIFEESTIIMTLLISLALSIAFCLEVPKRDSVFHIQGLVQHTP